MGINSTYWRKEKDGKTGLEFIVLGIAGSASGEKLEAWITPEKGSNLCRLSVGDKNVIDFDESQLSKPWFLGSPVLYPTPNRVLNGEFRFGGETYPQIKNGQKITIHGLVNSEKWQWSEPQVSEDSISMKTWFDFKEGDPCFEAFPFAHRLTMEFSLNAAGITINYTVANNGKEELPFGFALHPYFKKLSGEGETLFSVPADYITDCEPAYMPTGKLIPVEGTSYDLRQLVSVGSKLGIDNNYTKLQPGKNARIVYKPLDLMVDLETSGDFAHMVIYTPEGKEYFCIENQTCSINAHNVYDAGFKELSGLIIVPAGVSHTGYIKYLVSPANK